MATGEIQDNANEKLAKDVDKINKGIIERLIATLSDISDKGILNFNTEYFATLEERIVNYTKYLGYDKAINNYIANLDSVDRALFKHYNNMGLNLQNEALNEAVNKGFRQKISSNLKVGNALNARDIAQMLRQQALLGMTAKEAGEALRGKLLDHTFERYVDTVARDAIMQYDGLQNEKIAQDYGLKSFVYISSIIETSRPVCTHIKKTYGNRSITKLELQSVLNIYCPDGVPEDEKITFETVNGRIRTMKKGSGIIEGTNVANFTVNRGGHNCRHEVRYTLDGVNAKDLAKIIYERNRGS